MRSPYEVLLKLDEYVSSKVLLFCMRRAGGWVAYKRFLTPMFMVLSVSIGQLSASKARASLVRKFGPWISSYKDWQSTIEEWVSRGQALNDDAWQI